MSEETIKSKIEDFVTHTTELGETAYKLAKINAIRKTATLSSTLILSIITSVLAFFILLFTSIAVAIWLNDVMHSNLIGFLIVGAFYLVLLIFMLLLKGKVILPFLRNKIVRKIYE